MAEVLSALSARPLEVVLTRPGPFPEGTRLERRLISTVVAEDKATVVKVYQEKPVLDDAVPLAPARQPRELTWLRESSLLKLSPDECRSNGPSGTA